MEQNGHDVMMFFDDVVRKSSSFRSKIVPEIKAKKKLKFIA